MAQMDSIPYLLRGVMPIATDSSLLVSSSKYLNHGRMRDWIAMICLRKNGSDFPPEAELVEGVAILEQLRDVDRIEDLFHQERKINPPLDEWFMEGFTSPPSKVADYQHFSPDTLGGMLFSQFVGRYEIQIIEDQWATPKSQYEFFKLRQVQNHDLEHILTGAGIDGLGELVPSWFRLTNVPKFIRNQELAGELVIVHLIFALRYMVRTLLHYPQVWFHAADAIQRGMLAGRASDALFLEKMEPVLGMPLTEARAALGLREVVDRDTSQASAYWTGRAFTPPIVSGSSWNGI